MPDIYIVDGAISNTIFMFLLGVALVYGAINLFSRTKK